MVQDHLQLLSLEFCEVKMKSSLLAIALLQLSAIACHTQSPGSSYANGANPDPAPFRAIHLRVATHPTMVTVADVNKDGHPDILAANGGSGNVSVYLGDGKGGFAQAAGSPFSAGQNPADIATADFNGDGILDVVIANHGVKTVAALLGNGKGQFSFAPGLPLSV